MSFFKKEQDTEDVTPQNVMKRIRALEENLKETQEELHHLQKESKKSLTKIGITRFNPFNEIGGDQSFSIALLDQWNDGVVVTSYYGRELNRIYAKEIKKGTSEYQMSAEEKDAIQKAMGISSNPKSQKEKK